MNHVQWSIALVIDGLGNLGNEDITKGPVADLQALMDNWDHFTRDEVDGFLDYQAETLDIISQRHLGPEALTIAGAASVLRNAI